MYAYPNDWNYQQAEGFLQQLLLRSATDLDFRRQLLTDPQAAIEAHLGRPLNGSLDVRFIENTADATTIANRDPRPYFIERSLRDHLTYASPAGQPDAALPRQGRCQSRSTCVPIVLLPGP